MFLSQYFYIPYHKLLSFHISHENVINYQTDNRFTFFRYSANFLTRTKTTEYQFTTDKSENSQQTKKTKLVIHINRQKDKSLNISRTLVKFLNQYKPLHCLEIVQLIKFHHHIQYFCSRRILKTNALSGETMSNLSWPLDAIFRRHR